MGYALGSLPHQPQIDLVPMSKVEIPSMPILGGAERSAPMKHRAAESCPLLGLPADVGEARKNT